MPNPNNSDQNPRGTKRKGSFAGLPPLNTSGRPGSLKPPKNPRTATKIAAKQMQGNPDNVAGLSEEEINNILKQAKNDPNTWTQSEIIHRSPPIEQKQMVTRAQTADAEKLQRFSNKLVNAFTAEIPNKAIIDSNNLKFFKQELSNQFQQWTLTQQIVNTIDEQNITKIDPLAQNISKKAKSQIDDAKLQEIANRLAAIGDVADTIASGENKIDSARANNDQNYTNAIKQITTSMYKLFMDGLKKALPRRETAQNCGTTMLHAQRHGAKPPSPGDKDPNRYWSTDTRSSSKSQDPKNGFFR